MQANTIDEVINLLDEIINDAQANASAAGYFASLYKKMTVAIKQGTQQNYFDDAARMEYLDVIFANRYLEAYSGWKEKREISASWKAAFDAVEINNVAVIQHLLLGINAHINFDLGIAVAKTNGQSPIIDMKKDYDKINEIIGNQINIVQTALEKVFFPMRFLNKIDNRDENSVLNFCILIARNQAWDFAVKLNNIPENKWAENTQPIDQNVAVLAFRVKDPGILLSLLMKCIKITESSNIAKNISAINAN